MKTPLTAQIAAMFFAAFAIFSATPPRVTNVEKRATDPEPKKFTAPLTDAELVDRAFAAVPVPAAYDATGRDQFVITNEGTIYMSDQGLTQEEIEASRKKHAAFNWMPSE